MSPTDKFIGNFRNSDTYFNDRRSLLPWLRSNVRRLSNVTKPTANSAHRSIF